MHIFSLVIWGLNINSDNFPSLYIEACGCLIFIQMIRVPFRPRFFSSVSTLNQNLAPLFSASHIPLNFDIEVQCQEHRFINDATVLSNFPFILNLGADRGDCQLFLVYVV